MDNLKSTQALILLLLNLGTLLISLACPGCPYPTPSKSQNLPPKYPSKVKPLVAKPPPTVPKPPPHVPKPLIVEPPHVSKRTLYFCWQNPHIVAHFKPPISLPPRRPRYSFVHPPPIKPELPITLPITSKPSIVYPPIIPTPPVVLAPPVITSPPLPPIMPQLLPETPSPSPLPQETPCPSPPKICPTLKLDACVNELDGLVRDGIGINTKDTCCPVLVGLLDLDVALCLCTTIKAKHLNINIVIPIALQVLVDCGKTPPSGFQCSA